MAREREGYEAPLPSNRPLPPGSVLCLDIDGVCAPIGQNLRFHCHAPHPGFLPQGRRDSVVQFHPALPRWAGRLADAYDHVSWISTWGTRAGRFAGDAKLEGAQSWPCLYDYRLQLPEKVPWCKADAILTWIAPEQPVALVDDDLARCFLPYERRGVPESVAELRNRPGPLLLVAPAREVGLSRCIVDLMCAFGRDPYAKQFADRAIHLAHLDRAIQWPWPLKPGREEPGRESGWKQDPWHQTRLEQLSVRQRELTGVDAPYTEREVSWHDDSSIAGIDLDLKGAPPYQLLE